MTPFIDESWLAHNRNVMLRAMHSEVIIKTHKGILRGKICGRCFRDEAIYNVKVGKKVWVDIKEDQLAESFPHVSAPNGSAIRVS